MDIMTVFVTIIIIIIYATSVENTSSNLRLGRLNKISFLSQNHMNIIIVNVASLISVIK